MKTKALIIASAFVEFIVIQNLLVFVFSLANAQSVRTEVVVLPCFSTLRGTVLHCIRENKREIIISGLPSGIDYDL